MKQNLGSKDGKNNRRLFFLNRKRKIKLDEQELSDKKIKEERVKRENEKQLIENEQAKLEIDNIDKIENEYTKEDKNLILNGDVKEDIDTKITNHGITKAKSRQLSSISLESNEEIKKEPKQPVISLQDKKSDFNIPNNIEKHQDEDTIEILEVVHPSSSNSENNHKINDKDYFEKQILRVLDQQIDETNYQLKKMDSEMHAIEKEIDTLDDKEEVADFEKEIELLMAKLNYIKRQIASIQKTFEFEFLVNEPDNYLIYLVDEFKDKRKSEKELSDKLKEKKEFKTIVDRILDIEEKHEFLLQKVSDKKKQLDFDNDQVEKMNNEVVDIEDMKLKIERMLSIQANLLEEIKIKVSETVHLTEKVDYITKSVNHSILELFLLMSVLKHNLSIKNSVVAAVSAKLALDMIIKMTTPTKEKVVTTVSDVNNYEDLINSCLSDTGKLEKLMDENLNSVSSIRYTFEHDYKECSYLPSYKEVLDRIYNLEEEMKAKKDEVIKMKRDTQLQLEKNNAKVKRYGSIAA